MKKSDLIRVHYDAIAAEFVKDYRAVLGSAGRIQYSVYIWEDGEIESQYAAQGDSFYLDDSEDDERRLFYLDTIASPFYRP